MKKLVLLLTACVLLCALCLLANADTFNGTIVRNSNADPNLFFHDGKYYLTQTGTSRIAVFEEDALTDLYAADLYKNIEYKGYLSGKVYDPAITELFGEGATINGTWSPEIHYFSDTDFPGHPEYEGWYLLLGLRKNTGDSSLVRLVVLKSTSGTPKGPYGHPKTGVVNHSQPLLAADGSIHNEWACGQTVLRIPEGKYAGLYGMWVSETGRGGSGKTGEFYQKIMIAKMQSPWQLSSEVGIVTTPTQAWEYAGASSTHPRVVEGATPVYGIHGEIFITYSGSGYWSDYGIGQLTWNGGDPLETSSWVKLTPQLGNPIFTATTAPDLRGAGHASFLSDTSGNGFFCYHAYPYDAATGKKASGRCSYIEPYSIDYTRDNGVGKGVLVLGLNGNGVAAATSSTLVFKTDGEYLSTPVIESCVRSGNSNFLMFAENGEDGYIIYRNEGDGYYEYLATVTDPYYFDEDVLTVGETYGYHVYGYRNEEITDTYAEAEVTIPEPIYAPTLEQFTTSDGQLALRITVRGNCDTVTLCRIANDGEASILETYKDEFTNGDYLEYIDTDFVSGDTHSYFAKVSRDGADSELSDTVEITYHVLSAPTLSMDTLGKVKVTMTCACSSLTILRDGEVVRKVTRTLSSGTSMTWTDTGYTEGATHVYTAYVSYDDSRSPLSAELEVTYPAPAPFVSVGTSSCTSFEICISGDSVGESFNIYFGESADSLALVANTKKLSYTFSGLTAGKTYYYAASGIVNGVCGKLTEVLQYTPEHIYDTLVQAKAPTWTETGNIEHFACACGKALEGDAVILPVTGHNYELTEPEIPATSESDGKTAVYTCTACSHSYGGDILHKLGNGDLNGDQKITLIDALTAFNLSEYESAADLDGDGDNDLADILLILKAMLDA